eukprot:4294825-Alexandrium_andersonii.AAC.1
MCIRDRQWRSSDVSCLARALPSFSKPPMRCLGFRTTKLVIAAAVAHLDMELSWRLSGLPLGPARRAWYKHEANKVHLTWSYAVRLNRKCKSSRDLNLHRLYSSMGSNSSNDGDGDGLNESAVDTNALLCEAIPDYPEQAAQPIMDWEVEEEEAEEAEVAKDLI